MKSITVFTPTFNRRHLLGRLYQSLVYQTCQDFIWLVVDDGSTDGTSKLVAGWQEESKIEIQYTFKPNGGMHTAHNYAYERIQTELNVCIDSDDMMPADAIERILEAWARVRDDQSVVGLVGLDIDPCDRLIGTELPTTGTRVTLSDLYQSLGCIGDKKLVYRNSTTSLAPRYPVFEGERLVPLGWLYTILDQQGKLVTLNFPLAIVDYQTDGSSASILRQYFQSPQGFRVFREINIRYGTRSWFKLKNVIHYGFSSMIVGDWMFIVKSPAPVLSTILYPASLALFLILKMRLKHVQNHAIR